MKKKWPITASMLGFLWVLTHCSFIDKNKQNEEWLHDEVSRLKNASQATTEFMSDTKDIHNQFSSMCETLQSYQSCIQKQKVTADECHGSFLESIKKPQAAIESAIRSVPKPTILHSKDDLIRYSGPLMMNLILSKYFWLLDQLHIKATVSIISRPYISEPWTYTFHTQSEVIEEDPLPQYSAAHGKLEKNMTNRLHELELKAQSPEDQSQTKKLEDIFALVKTQSVSSSLAITDLDTVQQLMFVQDDLWKDDLKMASITYAIEKWNTFLGSPVFVLKGKITPPDEMQGASFNMPRGYNVIFQRESIISKPQFIRKEVTHEINSPITKERDVIDTTVFVKKRHGLGLTVHHMDYGEAHIGLMSDTLLKKGGSGYCYENVISTHLPTVDSEGYTYSVYKNPQVFLDSLCKETDVRYNFVELILHSLGHHLGLSDTDSDPKSLMFNEFEPGLHEYHMDGLKEQFEILNEASK